MTKTDEKLKKELCDSIAQLKGLSKDQKFADKLIDKVLSIQGQLSVQPVEFVIDKKDVIQEYDFKAFQMIRTRKGIMVKTAGYITFVYPWAKSLYDQLDMLLNTHDSYDILNEKEKETFDTLLAITLMICQCPLFAFISDDAMIRLYQSVSDLLESVSKEVLNMELMEDDEVKNEQFRKEVEFGETLKKDIEEYGK